MNTMETPQNHRKEAASPPIGKIPNATAPVPEAEALPPRTKRRRLVIGAGVAIICLLAYWQMRIFRGLFNGLLPYAPVVFPSLIAFGTIYFKDWSNYKPRWVRWVLIALVLAACVVGIAYQRLQREEKAEASRINQSNIQGLKGQVAAAQEAQTENTRQFLASLQTLSDKVSALQTNAATEALRTELASVKGDLEKTQKALDPPKAKLLFSFVPYRTIRLDENKNTGEPVTETTLAPASDGSLHVDFTVMNLTNVDAIDGEMTLQICDVCKFAKEPAEFKKLPGQDERQRDKTFDRILSMVAFYTLSAEIIAPPGSRDVAIGMHFRCRTCVREQELSRAMIHVAAAP